MWTFKLICLLLVLSVTLLSGLYPFFKKFTSEKDQAFPIAEALAAGVFLSVALIHMLGTASAQFYKLSYHYPFAFLLAGVLFLFCIFSLMTPIGIVLGAAATTALNNYPLLEPIFSSLAAGTFLYLGTLHGLENATLVKQCCDLKRFYFVILGFAIMAVVAIWT